MTARSGAYCGPVGSTDTTAKGTPMVCNDRSPERARWGAASGSGRRGLLRQLRTLGVKVKRGTPDDQLQALIDQAKAAHLPAPAPQVTATPLSDDWFTQRAQVFEHRHPQNTRPAQGARPSEAEIRAAHVEAVRAAGGALDDRDGATASVAAVRRHLPAGYARSEVDAALLDAGRASGVLLFEEANQKVLLPVDRDGAVDVGNRSKHMLKIRHIW